MFALMHERLASYQGVVWGWGGTLGVASVDFYVVPAVLWSEAKCPLFLSTGGGDRGGDRGREGSDRGVTSPVTLFNEQVGVCLVLKLPTH